MIKLLSAVALLVTLPAGAAVGGGIGGGGCQTIARTIASNWFSVKGFMSGGEAKGVRRPRSKDFLCIHPSHMINAVPKMVPGVRELQCYVLEGRPVCCDQGLNECASL